MAGGGGESSGSQRPPRYVRDALKPYSGALQNFQQNYDPQFFGGQTYAGMDPNTERAAQGMADFSTQGTQDYLQGAMQGNYLGLSPEMRAAVMDPAMDASAARFNAMGRYGSPASQEQMAKAAMQATMPYYNQERQRQHQAALQLPGMQQAETQSQLGAGQLYEGYAQRQIDEDMARWNFEQNKPYDIMQKWSSLYGPLGGAGSTTTQTAADGSPIAGALGGGLAGYAAGSAIPGMLGSYATAVGPSAVPMLAGMGPVGWGMLGAGALGLAGSGILG